MVKISKLRLKFRPWVIRENLVKHKEILRSVFYTEKKMFLRPMVNIHKTKKWPEFEFHLFRILRKACLDWCLIRGAQIWPWPNIKVRWVVIS